MIETLIGTHVFSSLRFASNVQKQIEVQDGKRVKKVEVNFANVKWRNNRI